MTARVHRRPSVEQSKALITNWRRARTAALRQLTAANTLLRFEGKYIPEPNSGCWLWIGNVNFARGGYGHFSVGPKLWRAHRWAYEQFVGLIPEGMTLDHLCRNKQCVNPRHLEPMTTGENTRRYLEAARA